MSSDIVYSAIHDFLTANWTATPLLWENDGQSPPDAAAWIFVEVYGDTLDQASIGSGSPAAERWIETGAVLMHVMVLVGSGTLLARQHATAITTMLRGLQLPGAISFMAMSIGLGEVGDDSGAWFRITARAEFQRG